MKEKNKKGNMVDKPYAETGELTRICRSCKIKIPMSMKHCPNCGLRQTKPKGE